MAAVTFILAFSAIVVITRSALVCPGFAYYPTTAPCKNGCTPTNDNCPTGMKCCFSPQKPCGYNCMVGKQNITRPGVCPSPSSSQTDPNWFLCDGHLCDVDGDCDCQHKCCPNQCGSLVCILRVVPAGNKR